MLWQRNLKSELNPELLNMVAVYISLIRSPTGSWHRERIVPHTFIQGSRLREAPTFSHVAPVFALTYLTSQHIEEEQLPLEQAQSMTSDCITGNIPEMDPYMNGISTLPKGPRMSRMCLYY